jgi:hypothetical protein
VPLNAQAADILFCNPIESSSTSGNLIVKENGKYLYESAGAERWVIWKKRY